MSTISTTISNGITLATSGSYTSPLTITPAGAIVPSGYAIFGPAGYAWTVVNQGTLGGTLAGDVIFLDAYGFAGYVNNAGGLIQSTTQGVLLRGTAGTVVNSGTIVGGADALAVLVYRGGSVSNNGG